MKCYICAINLINLTNMINGKYEGFSISNSLNLVDKVEIEIISYFIEHGYKIGDSIPNEIQLASELGVARSVLREALSPLKMIGLVEGRTRRGMYLREPSFFKGFQLSVNPHFMSESSLINLLELRIALEIGISSTIFERITPTDIRQLEEIVKLSSVFENNSYSPISEYSFHSKLYQITNNNFIVDFQQIMHPIMDFVKDKFKDCIEPINIRLKSQGKLVTHADLLALIKKRDLEAYKRGIEMHFEAYRMFMKAHNNKNKED